MSDIKMITVNGRYGDIAGNEEDMGYLLMFLCDVCLYYSQSFSVGCDKLLCVAMKYREAFEDALRGE